MCAIGRSPSSASRTPRWINSSGYFFGRAMAAERLLRRGQNPRFEASVKPGPAQFVPVKEPVLDRPKGERIVEYGAGSSADLKIEW